MATIKPTQLNSRVPVQSDVVIIDGTTVAKATIKDVVETGRPIATPSEAVAGTENTKVMTAYLVKQALNAAGIVPTTDKENVLEEGTDPIVVVATGQSNILGHSPPAGGNRAPEPGVFVWEQFPGTGQTQGWKDVGPDSPNWPWIVNGIGNPGIHYSFCRTIRRLFKRPVYLIMSAAGGQPIAEWMPGGGGVPGATGAQWQALVASCRDAAATPELAFKAGKPLADFFLWHQGEADADYRGTTGAQWLTRFLAVINNLRTVQTTQNNLLVLSPTTPVMVGELLIGGTSGGNPTDDRNAEIRQFASNRDPYIINVSSADLASLDNLHFTAVANCEFGGRRYVQAAFNLPKSNQQDTTAFGRSLLTEGNGAGVRDAIQAQAAASSLTALSGLPMTANTMPYFTGGDGATTPITAFARTILDDADAATVRATIQAQPLGSYQPLSTNLTGLASQTAGVTVGYRSGNVVGTVSQSSGTPTGAVIESGSNSNGRYTKFADGTMICWVTAFVTGVPNTASGALFVSSPVSWTYPVEFVTSPVVTPSGQNGTGRWVSCSSATLTAAQIVSLSTVSAAAALNTNIMAIGRWF